MCIVLPTQSRIITCVQGKWQSCSGSTCESLWWEPPERGGNGREDCGGGEGGLHVRGEGSSGAESGRSWRHRS